MSSCQCGAGRAGFGFSFSCNPVTLNSRKTASQLQKRAGTILAAVINVLMLSGPVYQQVALIFSLRRTWFWRQSVPLNIHWGPGGDMLSGNCSRNVNKRSSAGKSLAESTFNFVPWVQRLLPWAACWYFCLQEFIVVVEVKIGLVKIKDAWSLQLNPETNPNEELVEVQNTSAFFFLILLFLLIPAGNRNRSSERAFECFWPSKAHKAACKRLVKILIRFSEQERSKKSHKVETRNEHMRSWCDRDFFFGFVVNGNLSAGLQQISEAKFLSQASCSHTSPTPDRHLNKDFS